MSKYYTVNRINRFLEKSVGQPVRTIRKERETRLIYQSLRRADGGPHERLGSHYGGWNIPTGLLNSDSICYCIGCGEDISFDLLLIDRFNAQVVSFDPTPKAVRHVRAVIDAIKNGIPVSTHTQGQDIPYRTTPEQLARFSFFEYGIWSEETTLKFFAPQNPEHASYSALNIQSTETYIEARCVTLAQMMQQLGHTQLTLLKMNIEGAEYTVLASMLESQIHPKILCITFDEGHHPIDAEYVARMRACLDSLAGVGYQCTHIENWNFTFVQQ